MRGWKPPGFDRPYKERVRRPCHRRVRRAKSTTESVNLQSKGRHLTFVNAYTKKGKNHKRRFCICVRKLVFASGDICFCGNTNECIFVTTLLQLGWQLWRAQNWKCARQMHKFFKQEEAILLVHRMMYVMQIVLLKKHTTQFGVTLCGAFIFAKLTTIISITPPES